MNYKEIQEHLQQFRRQQSVPYQYRQPYPLPQTAMRTEASVPVLMRNHQRQVSMPSNSTLVKQERPISNYYEYEVANAQPPPSSYMRDRQYQYELQHQPIYNGNSSLSAGSLPRRGLVPRVKPPAPNVPISRPIYQTPQVQIYGSYNNYARQKPQPPQQAFYPPPQQVNYHHHNARYQVAPRQYQREII